MRSFLRTTFLYKHFYIKRIVEISQNCTNLCTNLIPALPSLYMHNFSHVEGIPMVKTQQFKRLHFFCGLCLQPVVTLCVSAFYTFSSVANFGQFREPSYASHFSVGYQNTVTVSVSETLRVDHRTSLSHDPNTNNDDS